MLPLSTRLNDGFLWSDAVKLYGMLVYFANGSKSDKEKSSMLKLLGFLVCNGTKKNFNLMTDKEA